MFLFNERFHVQVFFVLRKKQSHVTFLHVYHHTNMVLSTWIYLKYIKGKRLFLFSWVFGGKVFEIVSQNYSGTRSEFGNRIVVRGSPWIQVRTGYWQREVTLTHANVNNRTNSREWIVFIIPNFLSKKLSITSKGCSGIFLSQSTRLCLHDNFQIISFLP